MNGPDTALSLDGAYVEALRPETWPSPCFVTDVAQLRRNAALLDSVQVRTGAKILLALKGFAQWRLFPLLSRAAQGALHGCCASSPDEAHLARECFGGEVHAFAAAYSEEELRECALYADHLVFNSFAQWQRFAPLLPELERERQVYRQSLHTAASPFSLPPLDCGLRINPEHSEGAVDIYNPCSAGSRLGIRRRHFQSDHLQGISGLHFHTLCEQGADALARTLDAVEAQFGAFFPQMRWINFGGGHHITKPGYDIDLLCACIDRIQQRYQVQVYLEPGEAVALNAGVLISTVLDIVEADVPIAILDTSASCHMPDVLEMPYRPHIISSAPAHEKAHTYRLAGKSCLAGDVIGEYSFDTPLAPGSKLVFTDMAIYSMVKTTTFNGLRLPAIATWDSQSQERTLKTFGYEDFKGRLS